MLLISLCSHFNSSCSLCTQAWLLRFLSSSTEQSPPPPPPPSPNLPSFLHAKFMTTCLSLICLFQTFLCLCNLSGLRFHQHVGRKLVGGYQENTQLINTLAQLSSMWELNHCPSKTVGGYRRVSSAHTDKKEQEGVSITSQYLGYFYMPVWLPCHSPFVSAGCLALKTCISPCA